LFFFSVMEEYEELRSRFEKAILEIRAMRKELREAHAMQDAVELQIFAYKQESIRCNESNQSQIQLMAARIQDLTNKLANSEKQMRTLKQKLSKVEIRDKRRSLSLKERESFKIAQEVEDKLLNHEQKIRTIEKPKDVKSSITLANTKELNYNNLLEEYKKETRNQNKSILRRKSLDSETYSEYIKALIRLNALDLKVYNATESIVSDIEKDFAKNSLMNVSNTNETSLEMLLKLNKFERAVTKSKKQLAKYFVSRQAEDQTEKCLRTVNEILNSCSKHKNQDNWQNINSIIGTVFKLESIFRDKMYELIKKHQLVEISELNYEETVKLIAARVAIEFIILKKIKYVMEEISDRSTVLNVLVETSQLISNLKFKINGTKSKIYQNTSYIQYLTKVLVNKLAIIDCAPKTVENLKEVKETQTYGLKFLLHKQKEVNQIFIHYKTKKLRVLAQALALETFNLYEQVVFGKEIAVIKNKLVEDKRIQDAWILAQEIVGKELVQEGVSRYIMHYGQIYEHNILCVMNMCLNYDHFENIDLKPWSDKAKAILKQEMENTTDELTISYKDCLIQLIKNKSNNNIQYDLRQLLTDYTDVIAHKALIDAKIILLHESMKNKVVDIETTFISSLIQYENVLSTFLDENYVFENNLIYEAEYIYFGQQFSKECKDKVFNKVQSQEQFKNIALILTDITNDIDKLRQCLKERMSEKIDNFDWPKLSIIVTDWISIYNKCSEIRKQIKQLIDYVKNLMCKRCKQLQQKIQCLNNKHNRELQELRNIQKKDLIHIKDKWEIQRNSLTMQYEHEIANLQERTKKLEYQLSTIESIHSTHINELQTVYQRSVSTDFDIDIDITKQYKKEIKQLRALCEKGLLVMENSHRRIILELEDKHRHELKNLQIEKEQALSEETQATLAALDAMKKAHEHEVQKEIVKFKQDFIRQMQAREEIRVLHKEHE
jgi:hypothetical protein